MRIACLQFAPQVGDVNNNLNRADAVLSKANVDNLDLLVLPELAFSGYNFRSLQHISPYLEPTTSGITSLWARTTALKYNCFVVAGYPEKVDVTPKWPASPEYYNSAITVNRDGETIANYRKSFLYYTDETWALEGPDGFYDGQIEGLGRVSMGICMDLNPYKFEAPWTAWEFAQHVLHRESNLVILSMAWLTREDARSYSRTPRDPDMETLSYWLARMEPIIRNESEDEIIVIFANRCGVEDDAVYSGSSAVLGIQSGEVKVYGILGRGEKELLFVDTKKRPQMMLVSEPKARAKEKARREMAGQAGRKPRGYPYPEIESPPSSGSGQDSGRGFDSSLSINTSHKPSEPAAIGTIIPPLDNIALTPISPADNAFPQVYYAGKSNNPPSLNRKPTPSPDVQPRKHTPSPEVRRRATPTLEERIQRTRTPSRNRTPAPDQVRKATPSLYSPTSHRPNSPKSRQTSRSRGPTLDIEFADSPLLGQFPVTTDMSMIASPIVRDDDEIARILQDIDDDDEIIQIIESDTESGGSGSGPETRGRFPIARENEIVEIIDAKMARLNPLLVTWTPGHEQDTKLAPLDDKLDSEDEEILSSIGNVESRVPSTRPARAETAKTRESNSTSMNPEEWDSSFTRNSLGPRSRHVSPRPKSTVW